MNIVDEPAIEVIDRFDGTDYRFLSNFYEKPFMWKGRVSLTSEHAYQAEKACEPGDFNRIMTCATPGQAKRLGQKIKMRSDWDGVKLDTMADILNAKFSNPELIEMLKATDGVELVEGNTWHDNYWGNCSCPKCKNIPGHNFLGRLLMIIREKL